MQGVGGGCVWGGGLSLTLLSHLSRPVRVVSKEVLAGDEMSGGGERLPTPYAIQSPLD